MIKCIFYAEMEYECVVEERSYCFDMYKECRVPFCPPVGIGMYMDDMEWDVESLRWYHCSTEDELSIILEKSLLEYQTIKEIQESVEQWESDGWVIESGRNEIFKLRRKEGVG